MGVKVKVGARGAGVVEGLLGIVQHRVQRQEKQEDEFREFRNRLREAIYKGQSKFVEPTEEAIAALLSGQPFQGQEFRPRRSISFDPSTLGVEEYADVDISPGIKRRYAGPQYGGISYDTGQPIIIPRNFPSSGTGGNLPGFGIGTVGLAQSDPRITQRINELMARGMPREQVAYFLRQKGIDPSSYGL